MGIIGRLKIRYRIWKFKRKQARCEHYWRPAAIGGHPARFCDYCNSRRIISHEDFYAQFGQAYNVLRARLG